MLLFLSGLQRTFRTTCYNRKKQSAFLSERCSQIWRSVFM